MMRQFWRTLSFRLAISYAALLSLSMLLLSAVYYWVAISRPLDQIRDEVNAEYGTLSQTYITHGGKALVAALEKRIRIAGPRRAFHAYISPEGDLISGNLPSWPSQPISGWFSIEADVYTEGDEQDFSALSRAGVLPDGARLIVGRDAEDVEDLDETLVTLLPWVLGLTLAFGLSGGLFMSRTIGRRLRSISTTARQVMAGDLGGRVAIAGKGDDFDRLANTLNLMLARNQQLFESVRRVSDDVAHELRTPLARLKVKLETLDKNSGDDPALRSSIAGALDEASRLESIFNALLRIARIEGRRHDDNFCNVDLSIIGVDACELYAPAAEAKGVALRLDMEPDVTARADPDLLFQVISNLLDNALKHTPAGGVIELRIENRTDAAAIVVSDSGCGLRPGENERLAERFFRGEDAQALPGEGLGLSLVAAIVAHHHGTLDFQDNAPGLRVELTIPHGHPTV
ncbi:MAG: HAMP domain-containing histidine kinase [Novosphingobium sp.]|nr:HAMP domain-containing histidine kinase [Novosphingobium sp.]